ncbi:probable cytochrome P450 308a1 [Drosophila kikkawai]|uniref:Probable cytochrome P450 308a1 n=1 Tax=Drosophila kikkawai TaxID=30033 RepID=A0A6P4IY97_DROKI|nr:probable cytochrome P450 308a1 [Drosophila kikkawai]
MLLPLVLGLLLLLLLLLLDLIWRGNHWQRLGVRGPRGWPLVGNMSQFALGRCSYGEVYADLYRRNPGKPYVAFYRLFNEPALLIRQQDLLRQILVGNHFADCSDNAVHVDPNKRDILASFNPFLASGDRWRLLRGDLVPLFTPSRLRQLLPHVSQACRLLREHLPRESFEAKEWATRYTLQVIASAVFGVDAYCLRSREEDKDNPWLKLLAPLFQPSSWSLLETVSLLHSPGLGRLLSYRYVPLSVQHWLLTLVESRSETNNLLHWLDTEGRRGLDPLELAGHATTLVLEGYETSAMLLACALYELARNEDIQERLHRELDEQETAADLLDNVVLGKLHYTEAVLMETLRLHPVMQALQKRCTKSFRLPEGGPIVQVGTVLVLPVQAIHLDSSLHPEPELFRPERFLDQSSMGCSFLGFGAGPRMCPGQRFGLMQTKAALVSLLRDNQVLEHNGGEVLEVSPVTFLTASKKGIWLSLERRRSGRKSGPYSS